MSNWNLIEAFKNSLLIFRRNSRPGMVNVKLYLLFIFFGSKRICACSFCWNVVCTSGNDYTTPWRCKAKCITDEVTHYMLHTYCICIYLGKIAWNFNMYG